MDITELRTPAFIIDRARVERNCAVMIERARAHGVRLRPHVKTHKTEEIALMQTGGAPGPITVSTLAEARFLARKGFCDITYAFPITPDKLPEAARLSAEIKTFQLIVDQGDGLDAVESAARALNTRFRLLLKVDSGYRRAGVDPRGPGAVALARRIHDARGMEFAGILTHGGHAYRSIDRESIAAVAGEERDALVRFGRALLDAGVPCPTISAGSTPTAVVGENWDGVNELRPGNYVFFDLFQVDIGTCTIEECAAAVLATVAGHYPDRNRMLIDAGALALSKDQGADHLRRAPSFGAVVGHPDLRVAGLSQEHGFIESTRPIDFSAFPVGCRVRIIPNHACLAAALFPRYHVIEEDEVVDEWTPVRGW